MSDESQNSNPQTNPSAQPPNTTPSHQAAAGENSRVVSRRWLLFKAGIGLNGLVGLVLAVPVLRYLFAPWRKDSSYNSWVSLGAASGFPTGQTRLANYKNPSMHPWDGQTDNVACYVRNQGGNQFQVFAINCAHLGCPVRWFPQSQLFMCPCHGGVYYSDGSRAAGPPERGLFTYNWKIVSGELQIDAGQMPTLSNTAKLVKISTGPGDCSCSG
jgi:nitrite reductase/ring-hydroxylating ferredoxin subunit